MIVDIAHTPTTTPATFMYGGIGVANECWSADVSLSNISQRALNMIKPLKSIICDFAAKLQFFFGFFRYLCGKIQYDTITVRCNIIYKPIIYRGYNLGMCRIGHHSLFQGMGRM